MVKIQILQALMFLAMSRDEQQMSVEDPFDTRTNRLILEECQHYIGVLTYKISSSDEVSILMGLIWRNLEFLLESESENHSLLVLLPKGADVKNYFIWDNLRYLSKRCLSLLAEELKEELPVFTRVTDLDWVKAKQ